tara:strand:- start:79 stop:1017 length:939 start_codon:yes stop_codon:yes gene_type:complete
METLGISKKKLKAIVFTDIVNFTKISSQDEQKALDLIQKQNHIIQPIIRAHNGELLKEIGDGLLFIFDSSLEAVRCSIEIQQALKNDSFKIRIGIHQGDIFLKDGDAFGDDVNIASRVESFAPEGGISISDKVHKDIAGVSEIKTSFIGHRKLKGIRQETKIRCITSNDIPSHKKLILPLVAANISFIIAILSFIALVIELSISPYENYFKADKIDVLRLLIEMTGRMLAYIIIGYSCMSYYRGLSLQSQKWIVALAYVNICLPFILLIFDPLALTHAIELFNFSEFLVFITISIFILILINYFIKLYKQKL